MGSWNETCVVSHQSIGANDEVLALIMITQPQKNVMAKMCGPDEHLVPLGFPLKAVYNDYGGVEDVKKSFLSERLEDLTDLPIESVIEFLAGKAFAFTYGLDFRRFDFMSQWLTKYDENKKVTESDLVAFGLIKQLDGPFKFPDANSPGANKLFSAESNNSTLFLTEDSNAPGAVTVSVTSKKRDSIPVTASVKNPTLKDLVSFIYSQNGYVLPVAPDFQPNIQLMMRLEVCWIHPEIYKKMTQMEPSFHTWSRELSRIKEAVDLIKKDMSAEARSQGALHNMIPYRVSEQLQHTFGRHLVPFYGSKVLTKGWIKRCGPFFTFMAVCQSLGIKLIPQNIGEQCGDPELLNEFNKACVEAYVDPEDDED